MMKNNFNKEKRYSEMNNLKTFDERKEYLKLNGIVGGETFGFDRYLNQQFYKSNEWKKIRREVIIRDNGCDLGIKDRQINGRIYVHHMNPLKLEDIGNNTDYLLNPEFLVCVSMDTHNYIHYGLKNSNDLPIERHKNDTCPWKK